MVAALAEFHHDVEEGGDGGGRGRTASGQKHKVPLQNGSVVLLLDGRQLHLSQYTVGEECCAVIVCIPRL